MFGLIKKLVSFCLPKRFKDAVRLKLRIMRNYRYDIRRFLHWAALDNQGKGREQRRAVLIKDYHRIEKGLSLPHPRIPFGLELSKDLLVHLKSYLKDFGADDVTNTTLKVLGEYAQFHRVQGFINEKLEDDLSQMKDAFQSSLCQQGGSLALTKEQVWGLGKIDLKGFFESRYSIRNFSPEPVAVHLIEQAVVLAQKTPSVCNRQSSKVHLYTDQAQIQEILKLQNGNAGFREQIDKLLIVTSDLRNFLNLGERYQCWIDGGLFAMSLIYALHSLGLGSCCLNWSVEYDLDLNLRECADIPRSENIIMLIAVGHLPDQFKVACSPRKSLKEILAIHN